MPVTTTTTTTSTSSEGQNNSPVVNATEKGSINATEEDSVKSAEEDLYKVFVGNLSFSSTEETLKDFFKEAGNVLETIIIKQGRRPKGYGFVAYGTAAEAEKAAQILDKKELDGREISVQLAKPREVKPLLSNAEKKKKRRNNKKSRKNKQENTEQEIETVDPVSSVDTTKQVPEEPKPKTSVFVANLPHSIKAERLSELFKDFEVESALVAITRNGRSKGYGFVELKTVDEMNRVLKEFVNVEVEGRLLHISIATSQKNPDRKPKDKKSTESEEKEETPQSSEKMTSKKRKALHKKKMRLAAKEKEGAEAAEGANEAVKELKKEDGVEAAHEAQDHVKELKKEDGAKAAAAASNKADDVKAADAAGKSAK